MSKARVGVALLGLGVVGSGVAQILHEKAEAIAQMVGCPLELVGVLVRQVEKERRFRVDPALLTTQASRLLDNPAVDIVVEVMGGEEPALSYIKQALERGKAVATANKEVMAKHGPELLALAYRHGVDISYEASVGGGIPLIAPFKQDLLANDISTIMAVINGTTNYILTRMAKEGVDFQAALEEAQRLGYAEANPADDVEGTDAAYKLAILATLAFHTPVRPSDVFTEGITRLRARDFRYAKELGYAIKLLAIARQSNGAIQVRVHPVFLSEDRLLTKVDGVYNAVQVEGDLIGQVLFYGRGAGSLPTASAVVADTIDLAQRLILGGKHRPPLLLEAQRRILPMSEVQTRYYLRLTVADRAGVLAQIAKTLGDSHISIASVIQKETDAMDQSAEIVIMTHLAQEAAMQEALAELRELSVVGEVGNFVRVEG